MIESPQLKYAVLLKAPQDLRPADIARALAAHRKSPFQDVILTVKKCWGIVEEGAAKAEAEGVAALLGAAGIGAMAIPEQLLEAPPSVIAVKSLDIDGGLIGFSGPAGVPPHLDIAKITLIAASGFNETRTVKSAGPEGPSLAQKALSTAIFMSTGIPIKLGKGAAQAPVPMEQSDRIFYLDIVARNPDVRLRIDAQQFNFSCLREHMGYNVFGNLRILVEQLIAAAPRARHNRGTTVIAEKRPMREMGYESLADLERELRWLLTLRSISDSI